MVNLAGDKGLEQTYRFNQTITESVIAWEQQITWNNSGRLRDLLTQQLPQLQQEAVCFSHTKWPNAPPTRLLRCLEIWLWTAQQHILHNHVSEKKQRKEWPVCNEPGITLRRQLKSMLLHSSPTSTLSKVQPVDCSFYLKNVSLVSGYEHSMKGHLEGSYTKGQWKELFLIIHWLMIIPTSSSVSHN